MAFSAHKDPENIRETECDENTLQRQAEQLAGVISASKHVVFFTGAGISTSSGIPDFRGPQGVWTLRAQGKAVTGGTSTVKARPTAAHMALVQLEKMDKLQFLISQNCDGIHRRSGFPPTKLAELHGNTNLEYCKTCSTEYFRDFHCRDNRVHVHKHDTGRSCSKCGGRLQDSIINFGEDLPEMPLKNGFSNSRKADLFVVLGSSLTVSPACDMPREAAERGAKLVICNLQKTPLDSHCSLRIFAKTDMLMKRVMDCMGVQIPEWQLRRRVKIDMSPANGDNLAVHVMGIEADSTAASILTAVQIRINGNVQDMSEKKERFSATVPVNTLSSDTCLQFALKFRGYFNEPNNILEGNVTPSQLKAKNYIHTVTCDMYLDLNTGTWENRYL